METHASGFFNFFCQRKTLFVTITFILLLSIIPTAHAGNENTVALVMKALSNPFFFKMEEGRANMPGRRRSLSKSSASKGRQTWSVRSASLKI